MLCFKLTLYNGRLRASYYGCKLVIGLISSSARWINILDFHSLRHDASDYLEIVLRAFRAYLFDNPLPCASRFKMSALGH